MSGHPGRAARPMTPQRHEALMVEVDRFRSWLDTVEIVGYPKQSSELAELKRLVERHPDAVAEMFARLRT